MRMMFGGILLISAASALATDAPLNGTLHNTRDNGWLSFECDPVEDERLACLMTQVMIRKKLQAADVEAKYQEAIKGIEAKKDDPSLKELCAMASGAIELIRGDGPGTGLPAEARDAFSKLNVMQRKDMEQQFGALKETCSAKNLDGMRRFVRLGIEKESRTCLVSTNRFEQVFRPVKDLDGKLLSWTVADTAPQGDCGFVQMSRFRPSDPEGKSNYTLWQYVAKRATSNPEGNYILGSCKDFEEVETVYDWNKKEVALQCDYLEHSVM